MIQDVSCIDYNRELILQECDEAVFEPYVDPKSGKTMHFWMICRDVGPYTKEINERMCKTLDVQCHPRYYVLKDQFEIPWHTDRGTKCAINMILSTDRDPIWFRKNDVEKSYEYSFSLIDVQTEHRVAAVTEARQLFKMSIFDKSYEEVLETYVRYERNNKRD